MEQVKAEKDKNKDLKKKAKPADLEGCTQAFDAEQSRNEDEEQPCDDGVK